MRLASIAALVIGAACSSSPQPPGDSAKPDPTGADPSSTQVGDDGVTPVPPAGSAADVLAVTAGGSPGAYTFSVTLQSPDTGCERYADWWEVLDADGVLVYRRILGHSHVDEQPFTRSGGPVPVAAEDRVFVRAHMNPVGYGGAVMVGTPGGEFQGATDLPADFGASAESAAPQPDGCAF